jgi:hypothetical protein
MSGKTETLDGMSSQVGEDFCAMGFIEIFFTERIGVTFDEGDFDAISAGGGDVLDGSAEVIAVKGGGTDQYPVVHDLTESSEREGQRPAPPEGKNTGLLGAAGTPNSPLSF